MSIAVESVTSVIVENGFNELIHDIAVNLVEDQQPVNITNIELCMEECFLYLFDKMTRRDAEAVRTLLDNLPEAELLDRVKKEYHCSGFIPHLRVMGDVQTVACELEAERRTALTQEFFRGVADHLVENKELVDIDHIRLHMYSCVQELTATAGEKQTMRLLVKSMGPQQLVEGALAAVSERPT